jgi:glucose-6-phosphate 1-dehydrogenase
MRDDTAMKNPLREGLTAERVAAPCALVIYGASGDLTHRKLIPALFGLYQKHLLPATFHLIGTSRSEISTESFRANLKQFLRESTPEISDTLWEGFAQNIDYVAGGFDDPQSYENLAILLDDLDRDKGTLHNRIFYLSTPPDVFEPIIANLGKAGLHREEKGFSRLVLEKPFGRDLESAQYLNRKVREFFQEQQIYRIDHYLGKETVQNILVMRFGNSIFEPLWNRRYIDHVQITAAEDLGIGTRAGYYESSGIVRDMFQNHLFQVMCLVAMEPPISLEAESIRDEKLKILKSIRPLSQDSLAKHAIRGQYGPGYLAGEPIPGYRQEPNVDENSNTSTFAALKLHLDTWRWQGVPFFLRSGKRLPKRATEVTIHFKYAPRLLFQDTFANLSPNVLVLRLQPDEGVTLRIEAKAPGMSTTIRDVKMDFSYGTSFIQDAPEAYERLLLDCMLGDTTLFIRGDEAEAAWRALMPVFNVWDNTPPLEPFPNYSVGSWGPNSANTLLGEPWRKWRRL